MPVDVSCETFRAALDNGLRGLGLDLCSEVREKYRALYSLLVDWNRIHNLTRIIDAAEAAHRHFVESLVPLMIPGAFNPNMVCVDIGSGAGFPGLPLALARPDLRWTLAEKVRKKAAFLSFAAASIGIPNLSVHAADARTLDDTFDRITFRALSSDESFLRSLFPLLSPEGRFVAFLGAEQTLPVGFMAQEHRIFLPPRIQRIALFGR